VQKGGNCWLDHSKVITVLLRKYSPWFKGEDSLTTKLLLWEVPNDHVLETLTSNFAMFVLWERCSRLSSHNHIWQIMWPEQKKPKTQTAFSFGYMKTVLAHQGAKREVSISWNSHYNRRYDDISTCIYTFCTAVFLFFVITVIKRRLSYVQFAKKIGTLLPFLWVLGIFLFNAQLGTGTSYARAMSIFKIQMFILRHFTNLAAKNAAKQCMTKYHPQKFLATTPDL